SRGGDGCQFGFGGLVRLNRHRTREAKDVFIYEHLLTMGELELPGVWIRSALDMGHGSLERSARVTEWGGQAVRPHRRYDRTGRTTAPAVRPHRSRPPVQGFHCSQAAPMPSN